MNKIYRTLWNAATQSWVVVSELAKAGGKSASTKSALVNSVSGFSFTLIAASIVLATGTASATTDILGNKYPTSKDRDNYCFFDSTSQSVICGDATTKTTDKTDNKPAKSVVIGFGATNDGETNVAIGAKSQTSKAASIAIGDNAKALDNQAIAIGQNATANSDWDISIGRQAGAEQTNVSKEGRNIAIGDGALKKGKGVNNNIALGTSAGERLAGTHNVIMGTYADADDAVQSAKTADPSLDPTKFNIKQDTDGKYYIETSNTVALGTRALATQLAAVAIGQQAKAFGNQSVATGNGAKASGTGSVATGSHSISTGTSSIAIGGTANNTEDTKAIASDHFAIAMGNGAHATKSETIAIGHNAKAAGSNTISIGVNSGITKTKAEAQGDPKNEVVAATDAVFIGNKAGYKSNQNRMQVSIGKDSGEGIVGTESITIGNGAGKNTKGNTNVAISSRAGQNVEGHDNFAALIEAGQNIIGVNNIAIGKHAGRSAKVDEKLKINNTIALGFTSLASADDAIAMGRAANAKVKDSIAIGQGVVTELLAKDDAKDQDGMIAIGSKGSANTFTKASGKAAIAIGRNSTAIGRGTVTIGDNSHSTNGQAISIDAGVKSSGAGSVAIGSTAESSGDHAASLAVGSKSTAHRSLALGYKALAAHIDSVALGAGAETADKVGTNEATVNGFTYSGFAGNTPLATVSIGKAGAERTITNVAAGRINATSTDAINGSQLYLALNTLGNVGNTLVANVLGGDAAIVKNGDTAGTLTMSDIGGTGQGTIHDAIQAVNNTAKASKTTVVAGDNMQVDEVVAADGSRTYTVATKKDVKFDSVVAGGTKIDANGLTFVDDQGTKIDNTPSISKTGIDAGNQKVTNVQNGTVEKDSKDAVNGGQLFAQGEGVKNIIGGDTTYNPETGEYANTNIGGTGASTIDEAIKAVNTTAKAAKTEVVQGENIVVTSADGANGNTVYTVATAKEVTFDKTTVGSVVTDKNTNDITGLGNTTLGGNNFAKNGRAASEEQLNATQTNLATLLGGNAQNTNGNVTMTDIGGTGKNNINDAIKASRNEVSAGKNMKVNPISGPNGQTIYEVATADKVAFDEVKVGGITVDGKTNKISGIAKGEVSETSTDAVNGSQLHELSKQIMNQNGQGYNILNNRLNKVDKDLRAGIAGANAAAGLPQAYIPGKSMVAIAAGTYKGQNAIALGMSRISDNGKVIIKLTGNTNSRGDFGASIGAGYQW
ncbi:YadA-like family protein [Bisgaard Taxon 45]